VSVRAIFAERQDGALTLRRGFALDPGEKVIVVEDVVTTGGSTRETMDLARAGGGIVVGAFRIAFGGGPFGRSAPSFSPAKSAVWSAFALGATRPSGDILLASHGPAILDPLLPEAPWKPNNRHN